MMNVLDFLNVLAMLVTVTLVVCVYVAALRGGRGVAREVLYRVLPVIFLATSIGVADSAAHRRPFELVCALFGVAVSLVGWVVVAQARAALRHAP